MSLRTARAALLTALPWGVLWGLVGLTIGLIASLRFFPDIASMLVGSVLLAWAVAKVGLLGGATFAVVLAFAERGHQLDAISMRRIALLGACGGVGYLLLSLFVQFDSEGMAALPVGLLLLLTTIVGTLGALSAVGTLAIARRGAVDLLEEAEALGRLPGAASAGSIRGAPPNAVP